MTPQPDRRGLDGFDEAVPLLLRERGKSRWLAAFMVVLGAIMLVLVPLLAPVDVRRAFGVADHVEAEVMSVRESDQQPRRGRSRGPMWDIQVRWTDPDTGLPVRGTERLRSDEAPLRQGDITDIFVMGGSDKVSLGIERTGGSAMVLVLVGLVAFPIGGVGLWFRSRRWDRLIAAAPLRTPARARITAVTNNRRSNSDTVDVTLLDRRPAATTFSLQARPDKKLPKVDEMLEVWPLNENQRGPVVARAEADGSWWVGNGFCPPPPGDRLR